MLNWIEKKTSLAVRESEIEIKFFSFPSTYISLIELLHTDFSSLLSYTFYSSKKIYVFERFYTIEFIILCSFLILNV